MYYKEFLRARRSVLIYTLVWAVLFALTSLLTLWLPMSVDGDNHKVSPGTHAAAGLAPQPWPALFGVAALVASIMATVLGSTLSQENDGHLELALTKPYSRVAYASTMIAVDLAAIVVSVLVGFAFIMLHFIIFHQGTLQCCEGYRLVPGPDPIFNVLRFMLFPLAWYAIIVGLSASVRGKAGVVQGLIWPVALGLAAMREIPATGAWQTWHNVFVAINIFNPLIYGSYQDRASDTTVHIVGASALPAVVGATVLAAFVIAGWVGATLQWRRVEA